MSNNNQPLTAEEMIEKFNPDLSIMQTLVVSSLMQEYATQQTASLQARVEELENALHRDQSGLAKSLSDIRKLVDGFSWIRQGRGPYAWNDDKYFEEAGNMLDAIEDSAKKALSDSGKRSHPYCCKKGPTHEELLKRVDELEEDRKRWFDLYTNLAVKQQNTLIDRIAELEKENEKLMGLLEDQSKKRWRSAKVPQKSTWESYWQSYLTSHGLNSKQ